MVDFLRSGEDLDRLLPEIETQLETVAREAVDLASNNQHFSSHAPFVEKAYERLAADDHISAAHILFPRIEGLLRSYYQLAKPAVRPKNQQSLIEIAFPSANVTRFSTSVLRADQFSSFISKVIFPGFDWQAPAGSTRNTIGHGVVSVVDISQRNVVIAILTVHHLLFTLLGHKARVGQMQGNP
jgi:hypothetical protein